MNIYTNTLLGVAAIIGLIGLSATPAFADSIHGVLENNRVANETVETKTIAGMSAGSSAVDFEAILGTSEPKLNGSRGGSPSRQRFSGYGGRRTR